MPPPGITVNEQQPSHQLTVSHPELVEERTSPAARANIVVRAALLIGIFFSLDKLFALARSAIIARVFGLSSALDAFNAANNLPDLLFVLISGGALAVALIPLLSECFDQRGQAAGWELFSLVANLAFVVTAVATLVVGIFALPIVKSEIGIAPGFEPEKQLLVVELMRLNLVATMIFSISGFVIGGLHANQHFLLPALAPIMYNCGQIFGALVLAPETFPFLGLRIPTFGLGVHGLVYGVMIGAAMHMGVQLPGLLRYKFRWTARISLRNPEVRGVLALVGPRIIGMGAYQMTELIRDNLASRLGEGAVTALTYGWFIMQVPETIIGTAIGIALLPTLSELVSRGDREGLKRTLTGALRTMAVLTLPAATALLFLVGPLVQILFQGRAFTPDATDVVVFASQMFLVGLVGHSLLEIGTRTFYAHRDAITPTVVAVLAMGLQIAFSMTLVRVPGLGYAGLALSNSLAFTLQALTLLAILFVRLRAFDAARVLRGWAKTALAAGGMAVAMAVFSSARMPTSNFVHVLFGSLLAAGTYAALAQAVRLDELRQLRKLVLRKCGPR